MIYNYNKLTPFKKYIIQNFPYIDADFDALTNYELYAKVVEYLNKVIDSTNNQNEYIEELTNAFNNLHDYVEDYFENLDVQDEINNKLDEMATNGQLQSLINARFDYLDQQIQAVASGGPAGVYATLSDLQTADPNHNRIYVVTATGNWYYYNTSTSQWTSGGVYQSTADIDEINDTLETKVNIYGTREVNKYNVDFINNDLLYYNGQYSWKTQAQSSYGFKSLTIDNISIPWSMSNPNLYAYIGNSTCVDLTNVAAIIRLYYMNNGELAEAGNTVINESKLQQWVELPKNGQTIVKIRIDLYSSFTTVIPAGTKTTVTDIRIKETSADTKFKLENVNVKSTDIIDSTTKVTVKPDGSGDYTNPVKATNDLFWRAWYGEKIEIDVYEGTYDIYNSWEDFNINGSIITGANVGWNICNNMIIKGIGDRNKIRCECYIPNTESSTIVEKASCINMNFGGTIENITFSASNCRYCAHSDQGGNYYPNRIFNISKCNFEHLGNDAGYWQYHGAWMEGSSSGCIYNFDECHFSAVRSAYGTHTNTSFSVPTIHRFNNCIFENQSNSVQTISFESLNSGVINYLYLNNNYIQKYIKFTLSSGESLDYELHGGGNSDVNIDIPTGQEDVIKYYV